MWNERDKTLLFMCFGALSMEGLVICIWLHRILEALT